MFYVIVIFIIFLAILAARNQVFRPFIRNLMSKDVAKNHYKKRGKLWRAIVFKRGLFLRMGIAKLKKQRIKKSLPNNN